MIRNLLPVIAVVSALIITGCNPGEPTKSDGSATQFAEGTVVATVNGQSITEETLKMISDANQNSNIPREKMIEDLIKYELLYQEAVSKNLESKQDVVQRLHFTRRSILSQAAMQDFIASSPITDAEIQKEYEQTIGGTGQEEYKARHILTETEDKAKEVIQKLLSGGSFDTVAKEYSTGPTGSKGGDLGWFSAEQMVAPFSEAVVALKNGDYTRNPVKTQFGWHVILREDSRAKTPPNLDSTKANIQAQLQRKAIEKHLETLKSNAKIEIIPPKPAEPPVMPGSPAVTQPQAGIAEIPAGAEMEKKPASPADQNPADTETPAETSEPEASSATETTEPPPE
ncbi:MAG: peptidylprolyl isomerase [Methylococcales bacterium]